MLNGERAVKLAGFAVVLLAITTFLACGGDDTDSNSAGSASSGSTASGRKLNDCEYASALLDATERFAGSLTVATTATIGGPDEVSKAINTFDSELTTLIDELKGYQLSSDVAKVNNGMIAIFEDVKKQVPDIKRALESGDLAKMAEALAKLDQDMGTRLDKIEQENKSTTDKLNDYA